MRELHWSDEKHFTVNGKRFFASIFEADYYSFKSTPDEFLVVKDRAMIETELALMPSPRRIVELGIWQGGSAVLLDQFFSPERLVAVDFNPARIPALDEYARGHPNVRPYYGIDQADGSKLSEIVEADFSGQPIDLVIDDASHFYAETRASFLTLFPRMRPGGLYLIEDWSWAHRGWNTWENSYFSGKPSLLNLLVELTTLVAGRPDVAERIDILPWLAVCRRGPAAAPSAEEMTRNFWSRGKPILPTL
jgi:hypothetical protein